MADWEASFKGKRKILFRTIPSHIVDHVLDNYETESPADAPGAFYREAIVDGVLIRVVFFPGEPMKVISVHEVTPLPRRKKGKY
jgi:hypothetical protein